MYNLPSQEEERSPKKERLPKPVWLEIQALALKDVSESDKAIQTLVLDAQRESVQLPVVRQATADVVVKDDNGEQIFRLIKGQIVVCDIVSYDPHFRFKQNQSKCICLNRCKYLLR